jgi:hypothetical protein
MNETSANMGLMVFWADIDADYALRYQQWHNCEHMPERVAIPGFREGRRYRAMDGRPHFLMFYETESTGVLASPAYMAALNAPTEWTREALTHFRNPVRSIYTRLATAGEPGPFTAPFITTLRFDLPAGGETDYVLQWTQAVATSETVTRVRLWRADAAVSNLATSERKIYGGGPGKQSYLAMIERALPPDSVADPVAAGDKAVTGLAQRADEERGEYWLENSYRAPVAMQGDEK